MFGTGEYYRRRKEYLKSANIVAFADNNPKKQGQRVDGVMVISPNECKNYIYDYICILSSYQDEIYQQLISMGVLQNHILKFQEIGVLSPVNMYENVNETNSVILLSHLCNYTGAAIALLNLARVIVEEGYNCTLLTVFDGNLRKEYEKIGIRVIEEKNLSSKNQYLLDFLLKQKLVIANTIYLREIVESIQQLRLPIIWWLHESMDFAGCRFENYRLDHRENLRVFGVGPLACKMFREKLQDSDISSMLYMVNREMQIDKKFSHDKMVFAIIGGISFEKGHDIFLNAIYDMPFELREKCEFLIIGKTIDRDIHEHIVNAAKELKEIHLVGELDRNSLKNKLSGVDVIVSASRNDTMPTVIAEAMLNSIACIISDRTGMSYFINDNVDGLIFHDLDFRDLSQKMCDLAMDIAKAHELGMAGHKLYEKFFSPEVFREKVRTLLKEEQI